MSQVARHKLSSAQPREPCPAVAHLPSPMGFPQSGSFFFLERASLQYLARIWMQAASGESGLLVLPRSHRLHGSLASLSGLGDDLPDFQVEEVVHVRGSHDHGRISAAPASTHSDGLSVGG